MVLCIADHEVEYVVSRLANVGVKPYIEQVRTGVKLHITRNWWYKFLGQFGDGAVNKIVPRMALELDEDCSEAILSGWLYGDGAYEKYRGGVGGSWRVNCISLPLVLGMSILAYKARKVIAGIRKGKKPRVEVIGGRRVIARQQWIFDLPDRNRLVHSNGGVAWKLCRSVVSHGYSDVWNLSVKDDESYIANGAVVHNCDTVRYTEGFGVAVMEACAAGVVPFLTDTDALGEVYKSSGAVMVPRGSDRRWTDVYLEQVISMLRKREEIESKRDVVRAFAKSYDWAVVAKQWSNMIDRRYKQ